MLTIKKINKINHLGIFNNFSSQSNLAEFKKYNVIYGWNGTGKTTLSKLFGSLNNGNNLEFSSLEYTFYDDNGNSYSQGETFVTPIRVFNRNYINDNVNFDTQSSKAITVILGEKNKEILQKIDDDEKKLSQIDAEIAAKSTDKENKKSHRETLFTDIARTIGQGTQGAIVRNYNRRNAEESFRSMTEKTLLSGHELSILTKAVTQDVMIKQNVLSIYNAKNDLKRTIEKAKNLAATTVKAVLIKRLKDNSDISQWVESGLGIHKKHSSERCEFCGNNFTKERLVELTSHFNKADAKIKSEIDNLVVSLRSIASTIQKLQHVDKMNLYQEYRTEYSQKVNALVKERDDVLMIIEAFVEQLKAKKAHTTEQLQLKYIPNFDKLEILIREINEVILKHNKKTDDFDVKLNEDSKKIEFHYLSTIYDEVKKIDSEVEDIGKFIQQLVIGIDGDEYNIGKTKLTFRINENKAKVSSSHKACELLNDSLKKFLGHDEISFTVNDDDSGYQIMRGAKPATSLSEGERTAIAFVYFVTQLNDEKFNPEDGIIVVDDPISSLDSSSQFQAFSFLKTATEKAGQLFLLTHNFDFLKLVLSWVKYFRNEYSLYMIKNEYSMVNGSRTAYIDKLDTSLEKFESEYHYLFNVLSAYKDDGTIENAYRIPNIARKLLDSFLMFCVPTNSTTHSRLQELNFDEQKKTAIYKFVNDQSHITGSGFDPALVPETQKCIGYLFELMETTFQSHFNHLKNSIT